MGEACKQANKQTWQLSVTSALLIRIFTVSLWTFMPPRPASFSVLLNPDGPTVPKFVPWRFGSLVRAMSGFPWGAVIRACFLVEGAGWLEGIRKNAKTKEAPTMLGTPPLLNK